MLMRRQGSGAWREPAITTYVNEAELQRLIEESPTLLPGISETSAAVTIEDMREHAGDKVAWLAGFLEASVEQRQQIQTAVNDLVEQLYPLMQQHRDSHQALIAELTKPELNRQALEDLRKTELTHIDTASSRLVDGVVSVAEILTPEQRQQLASRLQR